MCSTKQDNSNLKSVMHVFLTFFLFVSLPTQYPSKECHNSWKAYYTSQLLFSSADGESGVWMYNYCQVDEKSCVKLYNHCQVDNKRGINLYYHC